MVTDKTNAIKSLQKSNGVPIRISTAHDNAPEDLIYQARMVDDSLAVVNINFSLPNAICDSAKLVLHHNDSVILSLPDIGSYTNAKTDIRDAVINASGIDSTTLVLKKDTTDQVYFTVYTIFKPDTGDSIFAEIIRADSSVFDTAYKRVAIISDAAHRGIIATIKNLCKVPNGTANPIEASSLATITDSIKVTLLATAMVDLAIAHNSPAGNESEENQGIFTDHIQFFDDVVRNWGSMRDTATGLPRLRMIGVRVFEVNGNGVVDPLYVYNDGTLSDYGKPVKERKNYTFYEGYTRFAVDMSYKGSDTIPVDTGSSTGIGILFRVTKNLALYEADLADSFNIFDSSFLIGTDTTRRIIIPSNDSMVNKFFTDGIWAKGYDVTKGEMQYHVGVVPVRFPFFAGGDVKTGVPFRLADEPVLCKNSSEPNQLINRIDRW